MRKLVMQIQNDLDFLAGVYARRLQTIEEYAAMPEPRRTEAARNTLQIIATGLEAGDAQLLTQFVKSIANQRVAQGFNIGSVQQALNLLIELLEPGLPDLETANFLWRTVVQAHSSLSQVAMDRLRTAEQQFRYLADNLAVGIFIHQDGILRYAGREGVRLLGYDSPHDLIGRSVFEFVHPKDRERVIDIAHNRVAGESVPDQYEARLVKRDGSILDVQIYSTLTEYEGQLATQGVFVDISARKQEEARIRESRESLQTIIDSMPFGVMITGKDKRIRHANRSALASIGYSSEEDVVGRICHETMCPAEADSCPILDLGHQLDRAERVLVNRDGGHIPILKSAVPVTLDGEEVLLEAFVDVTEPKRLEKQIQDLLQRRGRQVETSTEIAQEIAATPVLSELYQKVITLIKEQFGYYHAQLFLLDETRERLVPVAGYGEMGRQLLQQGHSIPIGKGVVGRAAAQGCPVLSPDVSLDPEWLYQPLLPETKGELAVPVILQRAVDLGTGPLGRVPDSRSHKPRVLGVLDVQSDQAGSLTDDDRILLEGLCGQIAIAIESARLRQETDEYLQELERLTRVMSRQGWQTFWDRSGSVGYLYDRSDVVRAADIWTPEVGQAVADQSSAPPSTSALTPALSERPEPVAVAPLRVRGGELIGVLGVQDDPHDPLSPEDLALVESVSQELAQALEGARLLDEEQRARTLLGIRVDQLDCLNDIGRKIDEIPPIPEFLQWVTERIPPVMQYPEACRVAIELADGPWGTHYGASEALNLPCQIAQNFRIGSESAGRICIAYTEEQSFLDEEKALLADIARRVGGYVENVRLLTESQMRAEEQAVLNEVVRALVACRDTDSILGEAYRGVTRLIGGTDFFVMLFDLAAYKATLAMMVVDGEVEWPRTARPIEELGVIGQLISTRQPLLITERADEPLDQLELPFLPRSPGHSGTSMSSHFDTDASKQPEPASASWLGVPMLLRDEVLGVMMVMTHTTPPVLDGHRQALLTAVANQTAVALENARLLANAQGALTEVRATHRSYLRQAWQEHLRQQEVLERSAFLYDQLEPARSEDAVAMPDLWRPEIERVVAAGASVVVRDSDGGKERAGLAVPITLRGQTLGVIGVEAPEGGRQWTEDEVALVEAIGEQLGQALESARLFADTQRRAERERLVGEISAKIRASTDMRAILETAAEELGQVLGTSRALVRLSTGEEETERQNQPGPTGTSIEGQDPAHEEQG
jgi:PAS domain S-box-containing protein